MLYALTFVGGLIVFLAPLGQSWRGRSPWSRIALWILGCAVIAWSILGALLIYRLVSLSNVTRDLLFTIKNMLTGVALGQLLLLLFARGFGRASSKPTSQEEH